MFLLNTSVFPSLETVHVQVPLFCSSRWDSEKLLPFLCVIFPGSFHSTKGSLPEGLSKVMVRLSPGSKQMGLLLPKLGFTVEGPGHLCHTHTIPKETGRSQETKSVSPLPLSQHLSSCQHPAAHPQTQAGLPSPFLLLSILSCVVSFPPSYSSCPSSPPSLGLFLSPFLFLPRPEEGLKSCGQFHLPLDR